jgi:hypothetical protein
MFSLRKRALAVGALSLALAGISTTPAFAVPAADGASQVVAVAGSDTIEDAMGDLTAAYNADGTANPDHDRTVNIPVLAAAGTGTTFNVPGEANCPSRTYIHKGEENPPTTFPAPNGSQDGKNVLAGIAPFPTALRFVGTDSTGPGYLCAGSAAVNSILTEDGFQPLTDNGAPENHCRIDATTPN